MKLDPAERRARIAELYAQIPSVACQRLCQHSCGPVEMSLLERGRINRSGRVHLPLLMDIPPALRLLGHCAALDGDGSCSVYDLRPVICRLWGASEDLPCPHGCEPEGGPLSHRDTMRIMAAVTEAGGSPPGAEQLRADIFAAKLLRAHGPRPDTFR